MAEILLLKTPHGVLVPANEDEAETLAKFRSGATIKCTVSEMRNGAFFRKWWLLAKFAFDVWSETAPRATYRGNPVEHNFNRFRKDLIILTGRHRAVFNALGEMRLEAESISWAKMKEEEFARMYSETINVILGRVLSNRPDLTEDKLRNHIDHLMSFDR